ncbi:MAG: sel1 repeat family protein [Selenomonadaceae bacterium]|nr:sel1 repeat family protein [Selenomonadaceae bacterium]
MKKILFLMLTLVFASNFFCTETFAKTAEEKAAEKEANQEFKEDKKREKQVSKLARQTNFKKVLELAEGGDVFAEMVVSYAYRTGQRVIRTSYKTADEWKKKVSEKDKDLAENFIPQSNGRKRIKLSKIFGITAYHASLKNNFDKAIFWAEMGASENDKFSFAYLGSAYYTGRGVGQDYKMAIDFLKKAGSEPLALKLLSDAYEKGNGVDKDLNKSKLYLEYFNLLNQKKDKKLKKK